MFNERGLARRGLPSSPGTPAQAALEPEGWSWHWCGEAGRDGLAAGQAAHLIQTQLELI